jgi:hypothetical protein
MEQPPLDADGEPPGGLACGSLGLSRVSGLNHLHHRKLPLCQICSEATPLWHAFVYSLVSSPSHSAVSSFQRRRVGARPCERRQEIRVHVQGLGAGATGD